MSRLAKIGFGGGCHWCTEAVFQAIEGVILVEQGFIASEQPYATFSEGVRVSYDPGMVSLKDLVLIHLYTHECTSNHDRRTKYRSAIYTINQQDHLTLKALWDSIQAEFESPLVTHILPFRTFKPSEERYHNYYQNNPERPFCRRYIHPKLELLRKKLAAHLLESPARGRPHIDE